jgi:hypothetical protein
MTAFGRRTKSTAALKMPSDTAHGAERGLYEVFNHRS